jgi:hypothetical protein
MPEVVRSVMDQVRAGESRQEDQGEAQHSGESNRDSAIRQAGR